MQPHLLLRSGIQKLGNAVWNTQRQYRTCTQTCGSKSPAEIYCLAGQRCGLQYLQRCVAAT
ncbi:MAG: hypothetical protein ABIP38_02615, partial [Steroidobacteraceae bacterium]